jgi:hypothetical protein
MARRNQRHRRQFHPPRRRRLVVEQFEPRHLLSSAPIGADNAVTTLEDTAYAFARLDFPMIDPNDTPQNALVAVRMTTLPTAGALTDNNVLVVAGQFVPVADLTNGLLKFTPAANANGQAYAVFTFQVEDDGDASNGGANLDPLPKTMTINVTPVNDSPVGHDGIRSLAANSSYTFSAGDWGFSDPLDSPADLFNAVETTTLPSSGTLRLNGAPVTPGQFIFVTDLNAGGLVYVPMANMKMTSFAFQVKDSGGTANGGVDVDPMSKALMLNVVQIEPTSHGTSGPVFGSEDTPYTFSQSNFGFVSPDDPPATLVAVKITTLPAVGTLTDNGATLTPGVFVSVADINAGKLAYAAPANANGTALSAFTFQVQDDGGTVGGRIDIDVTPKTLTINVASVNDPPSGFDGALTVQEETPYVFQLSDFPFTDANDNPSNLLVAVKITTLPLIGVLTDNGIAVTAGQSIPVMDLANGSLRYTPPQAIFESASFTFQVQDNGGTLNGGVDLDQTPNTVSFFLAEPPPPPEGLDATVTTLEELPYVFSYFDVFGPIRDPIPNQPFFPLIAVKITTLPEGGTLFDNGVPVTAGQFISVDEFLPVGNATAGAMSFVPAPDANGAPLTTFTFQIQDSGGTADGRFDVDPTPNTMTIDVTPVNDPPSFTKGPDVNATDESGPQTIAGWATGISPGPPDEGNQQVHFVMLTNSSPGIFAQAPSIDATGKLMFTPAKNAHGTAIITIDLKDDGGTANGGIDTSPAQTFKINVTKAHPQHNAINPFDVNGDGRITPSDPLLVINFINAFGPRPVDPTAQGPPYYDVDGDGFIAPRDALMIISYINSLPRNGEGEPPPNNIDSTIFANEDTPYTFTTSDFPIANSQLHKFVSVVIVTLPSLGVITDGGPNVVAGQVIPAIDITSKKLVFQPLPANGNDLFLGTGTYFTSFKFQALDDSGVTDFEIPPSTMTVHVRPVDDAPVGTDGTRTVVKNLIYTFSPSDWGFTDPTDSPANDLITVNIASLPTVGTLLDNGMAVTAGQVVSAADMLADLLVYVPPANVTGTTGITFQVQDDGGTLNGGMDLDPVQRTLTINIAAINEPPSFTKGPDVKATDESGPQTITGWATAISPGPPEEANQQVHFVMLGNNNVALFAQQPTIDAAGNLAFTPAKNAHGTATITIALKDDGGTANGGVDTSPPQTFQINITKAHPQHNARNPLDVNDDGHVNALDALIEINFLNAYGARPVDPIALGPPYYDVDADGFIAPRDALLVISYINAHPFIGEGEAPAITTSPAPSILQADVLTLIAVDVASQPRRGL